MSLDAKPYTIEEIRERPQEITEATEATFFRRLIATVEALAAERARAERAEVDALTQNKACAEEMLKREALQKNWDQMVRSVKEHYDAQLDAEAACAEMRAALEDIGEGLRLP